VYIIDTTVADGADEYYQ